MANTSVISSNWEIELFEMGDCLTCFMSFVFPPCALAQARTNIDGSNCFFNMLCVNPLVIAWLLRSAIGMPQDFLHDLLYFLVCPCCYTNQIAQTAKRHPNPAVDGGSRYNAHPVNSGCAPLEYCCGTIFCCQFVNAYAMNKHLGMNYWFALFCNGPFAGKSSSSLYIYYAFMRVC